MRRRTFLGTVAAGALLATGAAPRPLRLAMAGLVHGHAAGFLNRYKKREDVEIVGFAEPNAEVRGRYAKQFSLDPAKLFPSLADLLAAVKPEAVAVFTDTFDHLATTLTCIEAKLPVIMEKPLAVSDEHARKIAAAAARAGVPVLVNYETTWYRSNHEAWSIAKEQNQLGAIRKVVFHDGHRGPKEIGVQPEFLAWLTDPARGGGGALFDFGCYGANLMTWLMDGKAPTTVTAVTQRFKPEIYPNTDDEATIILTYGDEAQAILQASWNWPFDRKDMEIYGRTGSLRTVGTDSVLLRLPNKPEARVECSELTAPNDDFVHYLTAVVRGEIQPSGLSGLANNLVVTQILDAARRSAATGRTIKIG